MRVTSPAVQWHFRGIVIRVIIQRHIDRRPCGYVPIILAFQSKAVIFKVVEYPKCSVRRVLDQRRPCQIRGQQGLQPRNGIHFVLAHFGPAADRHKDIVGKSAEQRRSRSQVAVPHTAKSLVRQIVFGQAIKVIGHRHRPPANAKN